MYVTAPRVACQFRTDDLALGRGRTLSSQRSSKVDSIREHSTAPNHLACTLVHAQPTTRVHALAIGLSDVYLLPGTHHHREPQLVRLPLRPREYHFLRNRVFVDLSRVRQPRTTSRPPSVSHLSLSLPLSVSSTTLSTTTLWLIQRLGTPDFAARLQCIRKRFEGGLSACLAPPPGFLPPPSPSFLSSSSSADSTMRVSLGEM